MRTSEQIKAEIEDKFGFFPTFFTPAQDNPQVLENLWQQTLAAYVGNPLSSLFKEKFSAYLSRYCAVPYCMVCHSCSLLSLGVKALEVLKLLETPPPTETEIDEHLRVLTAHSDKLTAMQDWSAEVEESILNCSIFTFIAGNEAEYYRNELRLLLGSTNYQHIVSFGCYVKTCHVWMEAHPEVAYSYQADKRVINNLDALIEQAPGLADFFRDYREMVRQEQLNWAIKIAQINERKRTQAQIMQLNADLQRQTAELEVVNQELESFSYSVSHDLRAPLRRIEGFAVMLLEDCDQQLNTQGKEYLKRMRVSTQQMSNLIEDLLSLARVTRGEMRRQEVDMSAIVGAIALDLQKTQPSRPVEFVIAPGIVANADRRLVAIALENLLGNAWKYTAKHPNARIEFGIANFSWGQGNPSAIANTQSLMPNPPIYFVRDDGAGFDMAYADKLFGTFQRLHKNTEFEGTGVGLATVQRIIHRHGGRIWAKANVEQGATFYFTL